MAIADLRREYKLTGLRREDLDADPLVQFRRWFDQAAAARTSGRMRKFFIASWKPFSPRAGMLKANSKSCHAVVSFASLGLLDQK